MTQAASPAELIAADLEHLRAEWPKLLTHAKLSFDAEREWVIQACTKNDYAYKTAAANPEAVRNALRNVAAVGVTLDPARKLAYVMPRDKAMVYDLSYMGLIDVAVGSGSIAWAQAHLVHQKDTFELLGYDAPPVHKRNPFDPPEKRGPVIGAYVVVKTAGGDYLTNTMAMGDIEAIRARSQSWKQHVADPKKSTPWKTDFAEMTKKTVVKNAYKYWPRSEALDRAIHYLNTEGGQGIDLTPEDEARTRTAIWLDKIKAAKTQQELRTLMTAARKEFEEAHDADGYAEVRTVAIELDLKLAPAKTAAPTQAPAPANTAPGATAEKPAQATRPIDPAIIEAALKLTGAELDQLAQEVRRVAAVVKKIRAARDFAALEATGPLIDELPAEDQDYLNRVYNKRRDQLAEDEAQA